MREVTRGADRAHPCGHYHAPDRIAAASANAHLQTLRERRGHEIPLGMWSFGSQWRTFPRWLKTLTLIVGLPAWLGFAGMIFTGSIFEHENVTIVLFVVFGLVVACQTAFVARAAWRNEV